MLVEDVAVSTKAVVATCVVLVPAAAVTALNVSLAEPLRFALEFTAVLTAVNSVLKSLPDITLSGSESLNASLPDHVTCKYFSLFSPYNHVL